MSLEVVTSYQLMTEEARELTKSIVETVREPLVVLDADLTVKFANRFFYQTFQAKREETENVLFFYLGSGQWDIPKLRSFLTEILPQNTQLHDFEVEHDFPNIGRKVMLLNARRLYDEVGRTKMILLAIEDVTERSSAEELLKSSEAELLALFSAITDVIFVLNAEGRFVRLAPTDPTYLYKTAVEMIGKTVHELFTQEQADLFLGHVRCALDEGQTQRTEYSLQIGEKVVWFEGSISPMSEDLVIWIARDITERKRAEQQNEKLVHDLAERVKELTALHKAARLFQHEWTNISTILRELSELLPHAFQYPELIATRVRLGRAEAVMAGFSDSESVLRAEFITTDGQLGSIEVIYTEICSPETENPFLDEEHALIDTLADMLRTAYDHRQAELSLRESEERFRQLAENIREVFWMRTPNFEEILYISPAYKNIWGQTLLSVYIAPKAFMEAIHPEDRQRVINTMSREQGQRFDIEYRIIKPDGSVRWIWDRGFPVKDESGQVYRIAGIAEDITERKHTEQELRKSEERYRDLVENALDIIYTHDLKGNYISINKAAEKITGYTREEAHKMNLMQTVAPEYLQKARQMIASKLSGEEETVYDLEILAKDGHRVAVEVNTRLVLQDGVPVSVQGIARDITERKNLEEQLRQAQKMEAVGQLAGGISHDFNNLLTAINGYSELCLRQLQAEDPLRSNLEEIKKAGERASSLTRQLLAFSRKQILQPEVLELNSVVTDLEKMLQRLIGEDIELRTVLEPKLGNIKADPGQIEQVIMNLVVNARDAMPRGGKLTIETRNVYLDEEYIGQHIGVGAGHYVMLAVSDIGIGIDEETRKHIFEPFYTTKELGKGTGLGLSTVYGIVKQSGGDISVYSEVGYGTTLKVYLPLVGENTHEYKRNTEAKKFLHGSETILLVEDEELVRDLTREVLESYGYQVQEATNGESALLIGEHYKEPIHLLITDVVMPEMGGRELADRLLKLRPEIKVLYMSGYTDDAVIRQGVIETGANFIQKPFSLEVLTQKVRELLDGKK